MSCGAWVVAVLAAVVLLAALFWLQQVLKRGSIKKPEYKRQNVLQRIEEDYPEGQREEVLAKLDRWLAISEEATREDALMAQIHLSILTLARGDIDVVEKYTGNPKAYDFRDIITKAGFG